MHLRDIAAQVGLTTVPRSRSRTDRRYVPDTMAGGGVAFLDCDDGGNISEFLALVSADVNQDGRSDLVGASIVLRPAAESASRSITATQTAR